MDQSNIERLLHWMGCDQVKCNGGAWVNSSCPLAPWMHPKGRDAHPSFGIIIAPKGQSFYNCYTCGMKGNLFGLLTNYGRKSKKDVSPWIRQLPALDSKSLEDLTRLTDSIQYGYGRASTVVAGVPLSPKFKHTILRDEEPPPPLPESDLSYFVDPPPEVMAYLRKDRGLTDAAIALWEIKYQSYVHRIALPIRDVDQKLVGITGRMLDWLPSSRKYLNHKGFGSKFYLFGENRIVPGLPIILVEGFFDVIALNMRGYNALGMIGASLGPFKARKIEGLTDTVIIIPDGDAPGRKAADTSLALLESNGKVAVRIVGIPDGKDPDQMSPEWLLENIGPPSEKVLALYDTKP